MEEALLDGVCSLGFPFPLLVRCCVLFIVFGYLSIRHTAVPRGPDVRRHLVTWILRVSKCYVIKMGFCLTSRISKKETMKPLSHYNSRLTDAKEACLYGGQVCCTCGNAMQRKSHVGEMGI